MKFPFLRRRPPIAPLPSVPSAFVYTVHKAGSMFLHELCAEVAPQLGLMPVSKNDPAFMGLIDQGNWKKFIDSYANSRACYGPIRLTARVNGGMDGKEGTGTDPVDVMMERFWPKAAETGSVIVHLRDPRDVLTSFYYSVAYSHPAVPGGFDPARLDRKQMQADGVDAYVVAKAPSVMNSYRQICDTLLTRPNVTLLYYEDMVTRFDVWLSNFLAGLTRACLPDDLAALQVRLAKIHADAHARHSNDFQVDREDVMSHKRQVMPGDHRRKLKPETIERLNADFSATLSRLGYDAH